MPRWASVHPRVCGEQDPTRADSTHGNGSSPRVRGTGISASDLATMGRFIPACAGNSVISVISLACHTVHPRVCGEQSCSSDQNHTIAGSSPRVRGTGHVGCCWSLGRRFIPACAGNRSIAPPSSSPVSVHPRVCGEQTMWPRQYKPKNGSSPRVRGTGFRNDLKRAGTGFIPACAGNRAIDRRMRQGPPVHPRVCGEQSFRRLNSGSASGSSPRVRGTVLSGSPILSTRRFIPACAGNSASPPLCIVPPSVHPRVCGEQPR